MSVSTELPHVVDPKVYRSAVTIIDTPALEQSSAQRDFVLEQRPDLASTEMCNPGMMQLFGGGARKGERGYVALRRELSEETTLPIRRIRLCPEDTPLDPARLCCVSLGTVPWTGSRPKVRDGVQVIEHRQFKVALFRLWLPPEYGDFTLQPREIDRGTQITRVPASLEGVEAAKEKLAPFSYNAFVGLLGGRSIQGNIEGL